MKAFKIATAVALSLVSLNIQSAENASPTDTMSSATVKAINATIDKLEKRISEQEKTLPVLKVEYDFYDATEGVPPSFRFFFETKGTGSKEKSILRVCKAHIGLEVYAKDYVYYFDEEGRPMKFLIANSGIAGEAAMPASRSAIIYDKAGRVIWKSPEVAEPLSFKEITGLFKKLDGGLGRIQ